MSVESGSEQAKHDDIAIIGMAGRFPGAADIDAFWANIRDGVESIRKLTDDELVAAGVSRTALNDPAYVKACPVLEDVDKFDAGFFGFSPRDASVMDPAHRLFLEIAWQAVEHAGYTALPEDGPVGVFAGAGAPLYMIENVRSNPDLMRSMGEFLVRHTGNDMNFLATRVSYEMDLRGPSMNVQTACSSSLVSVHLACQSLERGECRLALAGGSTVLFPRNQGYVFKEGEILSPDGHCRPFDAKSAGTVFGSGAGVVILKLLSDALDDGDTIYAVIKGSAVNNDGAMKVGYLAPGVEGQAAVVAAALAVSRVPAESVSYIETHGTGTLVGDPIEVEALNEAYRSRTQRRQFCAIGSVKSNIGHLGEAASIASLIKAVMALRHKQLPPSLGFETPNPAIDFEDSPFFVNSTLRPWTSDGPLRCGITALGAGGTNCHMILEEAPPSLAGENERSQQLLMLSAKTKTALDQACENLALALERDPSLELADAAYTLAVGRRAMPHRRALAAKNRLESITALRERNPKQVVGDCAEDSTPRMVFMFPGGGAQYAGMGAELYQSEAVYQKAIDDCLAIINPALGRNLFPLLFPSSGDLEQATRVLEQPSLTLPSLFATEYALARLFQSWGVNPQAMIGHSVGEYMAACLSGVISLEDALRLVMMRGRLFEIVERGSMLSVPLSEADLRALMPKDLDIAAANAQDLSVASGPVASIKKLEAALAARDVDSTPVRIDVAAHSSMLDPVLGQFRELCKTISFSPPRIPFISNVTGTWITTAQAMSPEYWVTHLRSTVKFAKGLETLRDAGEPVLLEVGPGRTLSMLAKAQAKTLRNSFNCMRHPQETASDLGYALTSLGRLWCVGVDVDWSAFYAGQLRNRVPLPTYPFERKSYWVEPGKPLQSALSHDLVKREDISDWFYNIAYEEGPLVVEQKPAASRIWLLMTENAADARELARALSPEKTLVACAGAKFGERVDGVWRIDFNNPEHYAALLRHMEEHVGAPDHVVMLTSASKRSASDPAGIEQTFLHPTYLAQALGGLSGNVQVSIVTSGLTGVGGVELDPRQSLALGPALVAPREFDHVHFRCVDLPKGSLSGAGGQRILRNLVRELRAETKDQVVALNSQTRWTRKLRPLPLPALAETSHPLNWVRQNGVYLITGGLGGIGLEIAEHLARASSVKLALLAREPLPPEARWNDILAMKGSTRVAQRIARVRALRGLGAQVLVVSADVADERSLSAAISTIRQKFGPLNGVIHGAGVMDDAPMMTKSVADMKRVLNPKVAGTLALDKVIREDLDVFMLFSSVASCLGLPGQVDYTAANAFQDAFARSRSTRSAGRTVVINWSAWRDVGMAASAHRTQTAGAEPAQPSTHPDIDGFTDSHTNRTFAVTLTDAHWLLSEHVVKHGSAVLPGTAFVELARAAYAEGRAPGPVEITDLTFVAPFQVAPGETRRMTIQLTPAGERHSIAMYSGGDVSGMPIVTGEARALTRAPQQTLDIEAVRERCQLRDFAPKDRRLDQDFMAFGPRWANMSRVNYGRTEALIELRLDDEFAGDLGGYVLHPAMLDMATGGAQALLVDADLSRDFYVPLAYGAVRVFGSMPQHVFSHVRSLPDSGHGVAYFDVTLADATGRVFAEISSFTMKRLDTGAALSTSASGQATANRARTENLSNALREAIAVPEGLEALDRIMAQPGLVQVIASSVDVNIWNDQLGATAAAPSDISDTLEGFQRPELTTEYAAPTSPTQAALAKIWSELLGVRQVGVQDNFFDLGGNSLLGVRLFAAIRRKFQVSLPLATLFEAQTIAELTRMLPSDDGEEMPVEDAGSPDSWSPMVRIKAGAPGRTPFFFIHGSRGNVLVFKPFADKFGLEQPFYALQASGVDGKRPPDETIEVMAERYLAAIRKVQPKGPYVLAGYSGGGVIAYEITRTLLQAGEKVEILMLVDTLEPNQLRTRVSMLDRVLNMHRLKLSRLLGAPQAIWTYQIRPRIRKMMEVKETATQRTALELASDAVDAAYHRAQHAYQTRQLKTDAVVIRATDARMAFLRSGKTLGWAKFATGKIQVFDVDSDHNRVFEEPAVSQLAVAFKSLLPKDNPVEPEMKISEPPPSAQPDRSSVKSAA